MRKFKTIFLILATFSSLSFSQINWKLDDDSANFAFLLVDYNSLRFEGGFFTKFKYYPEYDRYKIPFDIVYNAPADYGNILFTYSPTKDTIFAADIWWAGCGSITYPKVTDAADQFTFDSSSIVRPYTIEYLQYMPEISNEIYIIKADSVWSSIKKLSILKEFNKMENVFRVGLYLYAPAEGVFRPEVAKWIIFLYRGKLIVDVSDRVIKLNNYVLTQNYPNPFNPSTTIEYTIPVVEMRHASSLHVLLKVYDILGREVATLVNGEKAAGNYSVTFNVETLHGASLPSGIYFYQLHAGDYAVTKKMMLMK
jgi:hypothetical protein